MADVIFLPVRHHSPACATLARTLFSRHRPALVLIEGPSDYNERISELSLGHRLPIALYSYFHHGENRSGAYYPFCVYSPEWQALSDSFAANVPVRFIDLPWTSMARGGGMGGEGETIAPERYADGALRRSTLIDSLCKTLGVDDFDALWDTLFEIDPAIDPDVLHRRLRDFCGALRDADELAGSVSPSDLTREAFMRARIREAAAATDGTILVVTGGYHTPALEGFAATETEASEDELPAETVVGMALTPYSYARLDSLAGYASGMPSPGFYQAVWDGEPALPRAIEAVRAKKQFVSTADLIAAETIAQGLANLRGHARLWRSDLLDGAISALVKEATDAGNHPLIAALLESFRGGARGRLADGTPLPPLTRAIRDALEAAGLSPEPIERRVELSLSAPVDREKSRLLHRVSGLQIPGLVLESGVDFSARTNLSQPTERWKLHWTPEFDGASIEASLYGSEIVEAAQAKLSERAGQADRDAEAAALLLLDSARMGLDTLSGEFARTLSELIRAETDFGRLARALGHLLYLFRFDELLGTSGNNDSGALLTDAFERGVWLLTGIGDGAPANLDAIARLLEVVRRCPERVSDRAFVDALTTAANDRGRAPALRGAAAGALYALGTSGEDDVLALVGAFAQPEPLGDFLTGLFTVAREAARTAPNLMLRLDELLIAFHDDDFLAALPSLRLAFSFFPPREKHQMARRLLEARGDTGDALPDLIVDATTAARALGIESAAFAMMKRFGLGGEAGEIERLERLGEAPR